MSNGSRRFSPVFLSLTCLFVTCLLISNIIAGKLISVYGMILPAAVILFPITYLFGDILTEVYGYRDTRLVIWIGFAANFLMAVVFLATVALPYPAFWKDQTAYATVLGFTPRLVIASLLAYLAGEFLNSTVLSKLKVVSKGRMLWLRTIGSTVVGQGVDTLIFIGIAFYGVMPLGVLGGMMLAQYVWKVLYETAVTPFTYLIVGWVKRREGLDVYDTHVSYNPFGLKVAEEE